MTEVEKLYSLAGVEKKEYGYCDWDSNCPYPHHKCNNECPYWKIEKVDHPPFTAEKQIELIKWLAIGGEVCRIDATEKGKWFVENDYKTSKCFVEFTEALANVIIDLWQDLTESEQNEIKNILKG